jgi:hypothetical protein
MTGTPSSRSCPGVSGFNARQTLKIRHLLFAACHQQHLGNPRRGLVEHRGGHVMAATRQPKIARSADCHGDSARFLAAQVELPPRLLIMVDRRNDEPIGGSHRMGRAAFFDRPWRFEPAGPSSYNDDSADRARGEDCLTTGNGDRALALSPSWTRWHAEGYVLIVRGSTRSLQPRIPVRAAVTGRAPTPR